MEGVMHMLWIARMHCGRESSFSPHDTLASQSHVHPLPLALSAYLFHYSRATVIYLFAGGR
ncbi:hypothetical protein FIBSPDRAFT_847991, partial [Athelia psychrophila]